MRPREGLAFFISAISAYPPASRRRSIAAKNPRGGLAEFAACSRTAIGRARFAAAVSSRLKAAVPARISAIVRNFDQPIESAFGFARVDGMGRRVQAVFKVLVLAGDA